MRQSLVIALLLVTAALAAQQREGRSRAQRPRVEQIILALDTERIQAQIHADAADLARLYADDFIGVGPSGTVRTKPQVIADFTSLPRNSEMRCKAAYSTSRLLPHRLDGGQRYQNRLPSRNLAFRLETPRG